GRTNTMCPTEAAGSFFLVKPVPGKTVTLEARRGEYACRPTNVVMRAGEQELNLILRDLSAVSGKILALDDSPLPAVVMQAVRVAGEAIGGQDHSGLVGEVFAVPGLTNLPAQLNQTTPRQLRVDRLIDFPAQDDAGVTSLHSGVFHR